MFINIAAVIVVFLLGQVASVPLEELVRDDGTSTFSYDPDAPNGPSSWGTIKPGFSKCGTGQQPTSAQSPIDIPSDFTAEPFTGNPAVNLFETELTFDVKTFNWELGCGNVGSCGFTVFEGVRYDLLNLHFHSLSEHTVNDGRFPLELHMVHISSNGKLLVISTLFETSNTGNSEVGSILQNISDGAEAFDVKVDNFIGNAGYCTYSGSLTTPPCSEGVTWLISRQTQKVSSAQVAAYSASAGSETFGNSRPTLPLNGREVRCFLKPLELLGLPGSPVSAITGLTKKVLGSLL